MKYSEEQIQTITRRIFNIVECANATLFDERGQPICPLFESLPPEQQDMAFGGMRDRIKREGLKGYIERKSTIWGKRAADRVLEYLSSEHLLD